MLTTNLLGKKACLIILFLFCFLGLNAIPSKKYSLVVSLKDGTTQTFLLSSRPLVTFQESQFVIAQSESNIEFSVSNVVDFSFADSETAVHSIHDTGLTVNYTNNEQLMIYGAERNVDVRVTDLEGKRKPCSVRSLAANVLSVSLTGLRQGVYLVSIGKKHHFKIVKK